MRPVAQWTMLLGGLVLMVLAIEASVAVSFAGAVLAAGAAHARLRSFEPDRLRVRMARVWRRLGLDG